MTARLTRISWAITVVALISGSPVAADQSVEDAAVAAAEKWLDLVDRGEYARSWETAASLFRNAVQKQQWQQTVAGVRNPFGKVKVRKVKSAEYRTTLPGAPDGEYVVIQFETSFENKQAAVETVTPMKDNDGVWRVSGYYIR